MANNIHKYHSFKRAVIARLDRILEILTEDEVIMTSIDDSIAKIAADMTAQTTIVDSLKPFIQGLFAQIVTTVPQLTAEQMKALSDIQAAIEKNSANISDAMVSNVPPLAP